MNDNENVITFLMVILSFYLYVLILLHLLLLLIFLSFILLSFICLFICLAVYDYDSQPENRVNLLSDQIYMK